VAVVIRLAKPLHAPRVPKCPRRRRVPGRQRPNQFRL
jgi:hypothetical protein